MTNSDAFDFLVCKILTDVCDSFPIKSNLFSSKYAPLISVDEKINVEIFYNTVRWLEHHGYLIIDSKMLGSDFYYVSPTEKTMLIMKTIPSTLVEKEKTLGQHIKDCVTSGTSDAFKDIVKTTLAMGVSAVLK